MNEARCARSAPSAISTNGRRRFVAGFVGRSTFLEGVIQAPAFMSDAGCRSFAPTARSAAG